VVDVVHDGAVLGNQGARVRSICVVRADLVREGILRRSAGSCLVCTRDRLRWITPEAGCLPGVAVAFDSPTSVLPLTALALAAVLFTIYTSRRGNR
jgi:hypothetical protein